MISEIEKVLRRMSKDLMNMYPHAEQDFVRGKFGMVENIMDLWKFNDGCVQDLNRKLSNYPRDPMFDDGYRKKERVDQYATDLQQIQYELDENSMNEIPIPSKI